MNPYRERQVPADLCPDCPHHIAAHDPSLDEMNTYLASIGRPPMDKIRTPRCHRYNCKCGRLSNVDHTRFVEPSGVLR